MKKQNIINILLIFIAIIAGFLTALLAAGVHSLFFVCLPIMAFAFGYFSSWLWGFLYGFILFISYTFTMSLIWWGFSNSNLLDPTPYIAAFITGGFSLLLIGSLTPFIRKGVNKSGLIMIIIIPIIVIGWCGYTALPHSGYYYQISIQASENINNLEIYLPLGTISEKAYQELYDNEYKISAGTTDEFTREFVETEHGQMLKITIPTLGKNDVPIPRYSANIIFWQKRAPSQLIYLSPKFDANLVDEVKSQRFVMSVKSRESKIIEEFNVPIKVVADKQAEIKVTLWNRTDRAEAVNFAGTYSKSDNYREYLSCDIRTDGEWIFVPVKATSLMEIRGIGD